MIKRVEIQYFRCLKHVEVELRPLTVLIGPNDSGKSCFLAALHMLGVAGTPKRPDFWRLDTSAPLMVRAHSRAGQFAIAKNTGGAYGKSPAVAAPGDPTSPAVVVQLPASGVPMRSAGYDDEGDPPALDRSGSNVAALVDHLLRRDRKRFDEFVDALRQRVPGLDDIQIATPQHHTRRIDIAIENGVVIPADRASSGVRLLIFFLALSYHPSPPRLILLEEPENGLHPRRLADVVKLLREITGAVHCGRAAQVIVSTHSPYLLDHVDLEQDQVLVFRRNDDGSRTAGPVDAKRLKTFLDDFMLGEVWFNEQEEGLIKRGG